MTPDDVLKWLLRELLRELPESLHPATHRFFVAMEPTLRARIEARFGIRQSPTTQLTTEWGGLRGQQLDAAWLRPGMRVVTDTLEHGTIESVEQLPPEQCSIPHFGGYSVRVPCHQAVVRLDTGRRMWSVSRVFSELSPPTSIPIEVQIGSSVMPPLEAWNSLMSAVASLEKLQARLPQSYGYDKTYVQSLLDKEVGWCRALLDALQAWSQQVDVRKYEFYSRARLRTVYRLLSLPIPWAKQQDNGDVTPLSEVAPSHNSVASQEVTP